MIIKRLFVSASMVLVLAASAFAISPVASAAGCSDQGMFGIPPWYRGLQKDDKCGIAPPKPGDDMVRFFWTIGMNIVQALFVVAGYVAVFFIIKGGIMYITAAGSSEGMVAAKKTIQNAIIGLIIAVLAASIVNVIAGAI